MTQDQPNGPTQHSDVSDPARQHEPGEPTVANEPGEPTVTHEPGQSAAPAEPHAAGEAHFPSGLGVPAAPRTEPYKRGPRVTSVVWGALILCLGVATIAWGAGAHFNGTTALAIALAGAGIALVVAAIAPALRHTS
ncbi:hypothetical protein [Rarobacter incanus]|uniref:Uncharacterized protein n=1 Tax=Rarobacter incanus TaxID=153494 RepID=A0A542SS83_9MICO|nr:hypothetical protein [Rarobacter incanus]TQK77127.1 hypothetical protein FB389_1842 [Rarobacter incanus]